MERELRLEKHHIEAWGLWWINWQNLTKERLRRHTMSTQVRLKQFEEKHLVGSKSSEGFTDSIPTSVKLSK
jgi:peptidoglycan/xylan/chitin deacetylase (PgdA/CDA1 family)